MATRELSRRAAQAQAAFMQEKCSDLRRKMPVISTQKKSHSIIRKTEGVHPEQDDVHSHHCQQGPH